MINKVYCSYGYIISTMECFAISLSFSLGPNAKNDWDRELVNLKYNKQKQFHKVTNIHKSSGVWYVSSSSIYMRMCLSVPRFKHIQWLFIWKFELTFVVRFGQGWTMWMIFFQVREMPVRIRCGMPTVFTDIHFTAPFFVCVGKGLAVNFASVWLQRTALSEALIALVTLIRFDTCNRMFSFH